MATLIIISPCRNEADYMRKTLDSVINTPRQPDLWVIVNDGSTDESGTILAEYAAKWDFIEVVDKPDRGQRSVGPGVIETFNYGLDTVDYRDFDYLCKLDLDLTLPDGYFDRLITKMEADPQLGTCSGKAFFKNKRDQWVSEGTGDDMSAGMTKLYRTACYDDIGGFVREVMWDGIDCHTARMKGWKAFSFGDEELRFEHLRPMGSSQKGILTGRARHGFGQYFMGSDPIYFLATCVYRLNYPPYFIGSLATMFGFFRAALQSQPQYDDLEFRKFLRRYQRRVLRVGKQRACAEVLGTWKGEAAQPA
ncbi:MAG: glycosyltransferase family A protein [Pseudomonadota bacterium]